MKNELGRIQYVEDIRSIWTNEAKDFTPWLADNLDVLGEELGYDFELLSTEHSVGSFSLDILAKDLTTGDIVAIENQLEPTDHSHLGQLLTYSAGVDAKVLIWISKEVRDEHRKAVDWLNQVSSDDVQFFAVEVQVIKINESNPAPLFKVKASPNEWSKQQQKKTTAVPTQGGKGQYYHEFFTKLLDRIHSEQPVLTNARKVGYDSWIGFGSGKSGYSYSLAFRSGNRFMCELYIDLMDKEMNEVKFDELQAFKQKIESSLGALSWERLDDKRACRIAAYIDVCDDEDMIKWGIAMLKAFKDTFQGYIGH